MCMCIRSIYLFLFTHSQRSRIEGGPNVFFIHNILQIEWKIKKNGREGAGLVHTFVAAMTHASGYIC